MSKQNFLHKSKHKSKLQKANKAIKAGKLNEAGKILTQLCNNNPSDISAWLLLASVYGRSKHYQGVAGCCDKVLAIDPGNTTALNYIGNIYTATNQADKAIGCYSQALKSNPKDINALNNLAILFYKQDRVDDAIALFRQIIELNPEHFEALTNLAKICTDHGYYTMAEKYCIRLNELRPNNLELLFQLGRCYTNVRKIDESRNTLIKCLELTDKPADIYFVLADNELHSNQADHLEKAAEYLSSALKADPNYVMASTAEAIIWYRQGHMSKAHKRLKELINDGHLNMSIITTYASLCHRFNDCDYVVQQGEMLLNKTANLASNQRKPLHFSLGRVLDKNKQYKQAFKHYQQANDLEIVTHRAEYESTYTDNIIKAYSTDALKHLKTATLESKTPVFIIGMPRSGTTLVEQILASHSDIHGAGELKEIGLIEESFIPEKFGYKELHSYAKKLTVEQLNIIAQHYLDKLATFSTTASRITDKMPQNYLFLGFIAQLFPQAKIVHCKRHPLDTILSIYFQDFSKTHNYSFNLENIAHYYLQYQRIMQHWKNTLSIPILEVPYINMVNDFEKTCRELIDFTGLEWEEQCLHFHETERTVATASFDQVRSPIYKSSLNRWKHYEEFLEPLKSKYPDLFN